MDNYCSGQLSTATSAAFRPVPGPLRDVFVDKVADTCALTMGSISLLTSNAVVELIQVAVDIGARSKGRVDVRSLMPHATTVMSRIDARAAAFRKELVPRIKKAIAERRCQASTDMWTDDQQKQHFITVTTTFNDEEAKECETHDLVVAKFPSHMKATAVNIRNAMVRAMADMGFSQQEFEGIEWITDRGANIKKPLEDLPRYRGSSTFAYLPGVLFCF